MNGSNQSNKRRGGQRHHQRRRNGSSGGGKPDFDQIIRKYENLLEQHTSARKKFFEQYFRVDDRERARLETHFYRTVEDLRYFEEKLTPEQKILFRKKYDGGKIDMTYSCQLENLSPTSAATPAQEQREVAQEGEDPHVLESQKRADFSHDREESRGSIDDYYAYKGISPNN